MVATIWPLLLVLALLALALALGLACLAVALAVPGGCIGLPLLYLVLTCDALLEFSAPYPSLESLQAEKAPIFSWRAVPQTPDASNICRGARR